MPAVCQSNPLQQFAQKGDQARGRWQASGVAASKESHQQENQRPVQCSSLESTFLNGNSTHVINQGSIGSGFSQLRGSRSDYPLTSWPSGLTNVTEESDSWLKQFSNIGIKDPLEFSDSYKRLYFQYEGSQQQPQESQYQQYVNPCAATKNHFMSQPLLNHRFENGFNAYPRQEIHKAQYNEKMELDSYFNTEFQDLENELNTTERFYSTRNSIPEEYIFDEPAVFKDIASDIVKNCLDNDKKGLITTKLANSKFMSLMRRISDGEVSIRNDTDTKLTERELYLTTTGETVGNEYYPIQDTIRDV